MPWYWILIIISAIVGPFEAMYVLSKARKNRQNNATRNERRDIGEDSDKTED